MTEAATLVVLVVTIGLVVARPGGLNEGLAALLGGLGVIGLGTASLADARRGLIDTAGVLVFLIAMMVVATIADQAGVFEWAADRAIQLSGGRGHLLFLNLYLLGALVTVFLSLDVTAIMVAPVVVALVQRAKLRPWAFILAVAYVANTASLFLPVSNLTNMLVYGLLKIPFWDFVRLMALPNLAAMAVNVVIFLLLFRRDLPSHFEVPANSGPDARCRRGFRVAIVGLALVVVGLVLFGLLGLPLFLPALAGAVILALIALLRGELSPKRLAGGIAWPLPLFVVGMYTVVVAAGRAGLNDLWQSTLAGSGAHPTYLDLLKLAFATALGSNLVNNLPVALVAIAGLQSTGPVPTVSAFAALVGTNVGPNITVFGSLATMLVLRAARHRRVHVGGWSYLKIGLLTTPPMMLAATAVLWLLAR